MGILVRQLDVLKERLTSANCSVERTRRILAKDVSLLSSLEDRWTL